MIPPLFAHQRESVLFFLKNQRGFDASDPGTGKTRVQLETFEARHKRDGLAALVLAPKSILRAAWENDARKYTPKLKVVVATADNRAKAFAQEADIYVTNLDATKWLAQQKASFFKKFGTLIIDEGTAYKHHTSQRSRALNKIKKHFTNRYLLAGVPNSNTITDVWNPYFVLDDGRRLGKSFYQFRNAVCVGTQVGPQPNMLKWHDKPEARLVVAGLVADMTIRHKLDDCIDLPPNVEYSMPYAMSPKQAKAYFQMKQQAMTLVGTDFVSTVNAAGVATKLLQIASGAVYTEDGNYALVDTGRYELAVELIEAREQTVVFYQWNHQLDQMKQHLDKLGIPYAVINSDVDERLRNHITDEFQAGFYRVILAHPKSAAHGFTWTKAKTTLWLGPPYDYEWFKQGNHRIYRAGQTEKTETIILIAEGTLEPAVLEALMNKSFRAAELLEYLQ
jgi:SNF2 family DNA or RNA helicase